MNAVMAGLGRSELAGGGRRVYVVAGERSGDAHLAGVLGGLGRRVPGIEVRGWGGPTTRRVAPEVRDWVEEAGVLGVWEVLGKYGWFRARMEEAVGEIRAWRPEVVLLVDYPGFNLRLARRLQAWRPGMKLVYYISPQVWAWHRERIPEMAAMLDRMLCIFPFEKDLYEESGLRTEFVGHPLVDAVAGLRAARVAREDGLVGLFPGSRRREVAAHFPEMIRAANLLYSRVPGLRFLASAVSEAMAGLMREMAGEGGVEIGIAVGNSREMMARCAVGVVASGTATLEAALLGLPHCLVYRVAWPTYWLGRMLIRVPHLGMANLLAGERVVPEFVQDDLRAEGLAGWIEDMLANPELRARQQEELEAAVAALGGPGGYERAAAVIAAVMDGDARCGA